MSLLRKNIWLLFFVVFFSSVLMLVVLSLSRWHEMTGHYEQNQTNLLKQWFGGFSSLLEQQENVITLVGKDILYRLAQPGSNVRAELDELTNLNPEFFSGFALISTDGAVLEYSSNLASNTLPNLLELPQTRDSFLYSMQTDKMVLGRTYLAPRLVIPARKAIRDEQGNLIGVMTGAVRLTGKNGFFALNSVLGPFNRISVLRERDHFLQYVTDGDLPEGFYQHPLTDADYQSLIQAFKTSLNMPLENAMEQQALITFQRDTPSERGRVRGVAIYNPRYEFWMISEIEEGFLIRQFLNVFADYLLVILIFQLCMYLLIRYIDREEKTRRKQLEFQADHDPLTRLPNRNYLLKRFKEWDGKQKTFSLLFIDLDNFKGINDNFGHSMGDHLLIELAGRFNTLLNPHEMLIRHGGDEFVLFSAADNPTDNEQRLSKRIYAACENITLGALSFSPGCSIGIARYPEHGTQLDELLRAADIAMYEAKKKRNSMRLFRPELQEAYLRHLKIEQLLRGATERGEIFMNYQAQVDHQGRLQGVESLVRWQHPELGFVSPDEFIQVAEATGQMPDLGHYIIDRSLWEIANIRQRTGTTFTLSINISVRQLMEEGFVDQFIEKIHNSQIPNAEITLEITETLLIEDPEHIQQQLQRLHTQGINVSLDDFGTGYSSLSVLRHLPLDEIKIDKSFVDNILKDETALKMVMNIIAIGRNYGTRVLAEGVETREQLNGLHRVGCDLFQGYYFSRPLSPLALEQHLSQSLLFIQES